MVRDRFLTSFQSADPSGCPSIRPRLLEQTPATCGRFAWNTPLREQRALLVMLQSGGLNFDRVVLLGPAADGASCDDGAEVRITRDLLGQFERSRASDRDARPENDAIRQRVAAADALCEGRRRPVPVGSRAWWFAP